MLKACFSILLAATSFSFAAAGYTPSSSPHAVATLTAQWRDEARNRIEPVKIYYPADSAGAPFPVIVFSHGLGGSRDGYGYLGQYWSQHGYVCVHVQHEGSDIRAIRSVRLQHKMRQVASDREAAINRPQDIRIAIDQIIAAGSDEKSPLHGKVDSQRIGVAGHSYGAFTTLAVVGAKMPALGRDTRYLDPRVKAAVAMSSPNFDGNETDAAFAAVTVPVFHLTGTEDGMPPMTDQSRALGIVGDTTPAQRRRPFDHTTRADAYLLTLTGGDHMVFSGRLGAARTNDREFHRLICEGTTAFWDAFLRGDRTAREWLEKSFSADVGSLGVFEQKHPAPASTPPAP